MGGRGASSGVSDKGKRYGTEYTTVAQFGNIKVIKINSGSVTAPMETMTKGRIYAVLDNQNNIKHITFFDKEGERKKQVDLTGHKHKGLEQHTHIGYEHDELGTRAVSEELKIVNYVRQNWERRRKRLGL